MTSQKTPEAHPLHDIDFKDIPTDPELIRHGLLLRNRILSSLRTEIDTGTFNWHDYKKLTDLCLGLTPEI